MSHIRIELGEVKTAITVHSKFCIGPVVGLDCRQTRQARQLIDRNVMSVHFNQRLIKAIIGELQLVQCELNAIEIDGQAIAHLIVGGDHLQAEINSSQIFKLICRWFVLGGFEFACIATQLSQFAKRAVNELRKGGQVDTVDLVALQSLQAFKMGQMLASKILIEAQKTDHIRIGESNVVDAG